MTKIKEENLLTLGLQIKVRINDCILVMLDSYVFIKWMLILNLTVKRKEEEEENRKNE